MVLCLTTDELPESCGLTPLGKCSKAGYNYTRALGWCGSSGNVARCSMHQVPDLEGCMAIYWHTHVAETTIYALEVGGGRASLFSSRYSQISDQNAN